MPLNRLQSSLEQPPVSLLVPQISISTFGATAAFAASCRPAPEQRIPDHHAECSVVLFLTLLKRK